MTSPEDTWIYLQTLVDQLAASGLEHVCICPGSRSTPLTMVLHHHADIRVWMHIDERSAAFFALGLAKERRSPVAVVSTSGTAAANFLPAVVEARYGRVPLLVLTADRPPELRDVGANQAIDQVKMYGDYVKWFSDVALPDASEVGLRYIQSTAARAMASSTGQPAGPVHLNFPFRDPLIPKPPPAVNDMRQQAAQRPAVVVQSGGRAPDPEPLERLARDLRELRRGLILCGPQDDPSLPGAVASLARSLGYPILADPLSQVRGGPHDRRLVIDAYDAFLRDESSVSHLEPEVVIRLGATPTSKSLMQYLQRFPQVRHIVIDDDPQWRDPWLLASDVITADPSATCRILGEACDAHPGTGGELWHFRWSRVNRLAKDAISTWMAACQEPFEGAVLAQLASVLPDDAVLFVGSSMPVRDLDSFCHGTERFLRILGNRGASGIDGVVSTALGAATSGKPVVLVIGDLSFYHDLNGLLAAGMHHINLTIVLLNNDGGGIFSFLPQAEHANFFETLFGTPHGLDFRPAVEMYGGRYQLLESAQSLPGALEGMNQHGLRVFELRTDRQRNVELHGEIWAAVSAACAPDLQVETVE